MAIWQIAAGDGARDYAAVFLKFGVILVGPGSPGPYQGHESEYDTPGQWAHRGFIRPFVRDLTDGDLVALKRPAGGAWEIIAVGEVVGPYQHLEAFADVDGWDLQHSRAVKWKRRETAPIIQGLRRGTLNRVNHPGASRAVLEVWANGIEIAPSSSPIPSETVEVDEVTDALIQDGLPMRSAEEVAKTIWRLRRLAKWYSVHGADVSEHEIRTFLIVPLLTSLGWAEQKIKIEWRSIDVALFDDPYRETSTPSIILESKRIFDGLRYAPEQATRYAKSFLGCDRFIVSDGIRYKLFSRSEATWQFTAYMNLLEPQRNFPLDTEVYGSIPFFRALLPR